MPEVSRRRLFGLLAGAAAAPIAIQAGGSVASRRIFPGVSPDLVWEPTTNFMEELSAVTRKAFYPKLASQIYEASPLIRFAQGVHK